MEFEKQKLWIDAFHSPKNDPHQQQRQRLAQSYLRMRENVESLITTIPADCKDLTVHSISHLDALWEMASMLCADSLSLNPAETFVLGGAILLHDAGMSVASFPGGLEEIMATAEWGDIYAATLRQSGITPNNTRHSELPAHLLNEIKFAVLRSLHAGQAENMSSKPWISPTAGSIYLLDDVELRQAFGHSIGRIAHSHHWDIDKVADDLSETIGSGTVLPADWHVNEKKIACILRCADASHIDRRRAPTILQAATRPVGVSGIHWASQNRLNKPVRRGSNLIYTSGQSFPIEDADAWWLCYDLVRLIDDEIRKSNALLEEIGQKQFAVQRVAGADGPRSLSRHVRPVGWRPVDAAVRASDPTHLARTLGGKNLYGSNPIAPLKEILQNAADAVRARRLLEERDSTWGRIRITIDQCEDSDECWLNVDDTGIGMSERVLCGPLIDFGKSIWNSPILREEFPGLQSRDVRPIGKFGIGFFSIFGLGDEIKVISKHYRSSESEANTLVFHSLNGRPILRPADFDELPRDFSTRISVKVKNYKSVSQPPQPELDRLNALYIRSRHDTEHFPYSDHVRRLISMVDVEIEYVDNISGISFKHDPDPYNSSIDDFLQIVLLGTDRVLMQKLISAHRDCVRPMKDHAGNVFGMAALRITNEFDKSERYSSYSHVSVEGFVYPESSSIRVPIVGIVSGTTSQAARRFASPTAPAPVLAAWATEQGEILDRSKYLSGELMRAAQYIYTLNGDPGSLPFCFHDRQLIDITTARKIISTLSEVRVLMSRSSNDGIGIRGYSSIDATARELNMAQGTFVLGEGSEYGFIKEALARKIIENGGGEVQVDDLQARSESLRVFLQLVGDAWGEKLALTVKNQSVFQSTVHSTPGRQWVLLIRPERT